MEVGSHSLSATISSTSTVGSSNSPTSTCTGLTPTGSCQKEKQLSRCWGVTSWGDACRTTQWGRKPQDKLMM